MEYDRKVYRIGNRKIYEFHYLDGEEHIYDYDENRMLTDAEKREQTIQIKRCDIMDHNQKNIIIKLEER